MPGIGIGIGIGISTPNSGMQWSLYPPLGKLISIPAAPTTPPKAVEIVRILVEEHEIRSRSD